MTIKDDAIAMRRQGLPFEEIAMKLGIRVKDAFSFCAKNEKVDAAATPIEKAVEVREWLEAQEEDREKRCTEMAKEAHALWEAGADPADVVQFISKFLVREIVRAALRQTIEDTEGGPTGSETEAPAAEVDEVVCRYCGGSGKVWPHTADSQTVKIRCRHCLGTGMEKKYA